jgi:hypothetical protein
MPARQREPTKKIGSSDAAQVRYKMAKMKRRGVEAEGLLVTSRTRLIPRWA